MKGRLNIFFLTIAIVLNFAHDIQPHEHLSDEIRHLILDCFSNHEHHGDNEEHHEHDKSANQSSEYPFPHTHFFQLHDYFQIRNAYKQNQLVADVLAILPFDDFDTFDIEFRQIFLFFKPLKNSKYFSYNQPLRGPPIYS